MDKKRGTDYEKVWTADICRYFLCVMPAGAICPKKGRQMQPAGIFLY
jgi:hypothetical protein